MGVVRKLILVEVAVLLAFSFLFRDGDGVLLGVKTVPVSRVYHVTVPPTWVHAIAEQETDWYCVLHRLSHVTSPDESRTPERVSSANTVPHNPNEDHRRCSS